MAGIPEHSYIIQAIRLLKRANNTGHVMIAELARELRVNKLEMMVYIDDKPKLFHTVQMHQYKGNRRVKDLGLAVVEAYPSPTHNHRTEEWLLHKQSTKARYIHITEIDYYGVHGYCIEQDLPPDKDEDEGYRFYKWRNTASKLTAFDKLKLTTDSGVTLGGFGDSFFRKCSRMITPANIKKMEEAGWTHNEVGPMSH